MINLIKIDQKWINELKFFQSELDEEYEGPVYLRREKDLKAWIIKVQQMENKSLEVPVSTFFAVREFDRKIIGHLSLRHRLDDFYFNYGGNIGYGVISSERGKGYAKEILRLGLKECRHLKMEKVLITCNKDNVASAKVINANGGVIEDERKYYGVTKQRYWIEI